MMNPWKRKNPDHPPNETKFSNIKRIKKDNYNIKINKVLGFTQIL